MKCDRAKLLFVGYADQGKTSLLHILKEKKALQQARSSTDGVEVNTWIERNKQGEEITFSTWDFAGQEVTNHSHCLFISHTSPAVLCDPSTLYVK